MINALKYCIVTIALVAVCYKSTNVRRHKIAEQPLVYRSAHRDTAMPVRLVNFAKTLIGTPYKYACSDPKTGFDCSGFISYVFGHFQLTVPRSSVDFTDLGKEVSTGDAQPGDLILFTGTNSAIRVVGHMGIVTENSDSLRFIHSTSGKEFAVTITPLNEYYKGRFVKLIRVFDTAGTLKL